MLCHLPYPYDDELLYSIIARYLVRIGAKSPFSVIDHVFGHRLVAQVDLPGSLHVVSERTWPVWRMTGEEIADHLTLFPYYSSYLPNWIVEKSLKSLLSDKDYSPFMQLGVIFRRVKVPRFLRFCRVCRESDLSKYGETYWRRSHQLAGVLVCPEHGQVLLDSNAPMRPNGRYDFADATVSTFDVASRSEDNLSKADATIALKVARRSQKILSMSIKPWNTEQIKMPYRHAAFERGFAISKNYSGLSQSKLRSAFVLFYGNSLLSRLNCAVELNLENYSWLEKIFSNNQKLTFHAVEHALVQIFLESTPLDPRKLLQFESGPWKCPNPYATHEEQFPITRPQKVFYKKGGDLMASVRCSCGFYFTFARTSAGDPYLPVVNTVMERGPTWTIEAERLKKSGLSIHAIAKQMGLYYNDIVRYLKKGQNNPPISSEEIAKWREEWLKLLDVVPYRNRTLAKKKNPTLHKLLSLHDHDWFYKEPRLRARKRIHSRKIRVDWASRDIEWAEMLRSAASTIMQAKPMKWVTRSAIIRASGLTSLFCNGHLLPVCCSVLKECSESVNDCCERRLRAAAVKAREIGRPLNIGVLLELSNLGKQRLNPYLSAVISTLTAEIEN